MRLTPRVAGFRSEHPAGFKLECMAGFVGTRNPHQRRYGSIIGGTLHRDVHTGLACRAVCYRREKELIKNVVRKISRPREFGERSGLGNDGGMSA